MAVYKIKVTTLSPLHIGDGNELRHLFDFVMHKKADKSYTYRLDEEAILQHFASCLTPRRDGSYPLPGELLSEVDFQNPAFFRYTLPGDPRSKKPDARLKTCIKDAFDRPYIPGSSIKGAMRTALAWTGWAEIHPKLDWNAIENPRNSAGHLLEKKFFGPDPNHDLLRALQVSDCAGLQKAGGRLQVVNAQVLTHKSAASPIELEAVINDTTFTGSLHIDETVFSAVAEKKLHFSSRRHWLDELLPRIQAHSNARIQQLLDWYQQTEGCESITGFYRQLAELKLGKKHALMQVGWGSGWDGKTFWTHLQKDPVFFEQIIQKFRMHKAAAGSPPRRPGSSFPRSKRVVVKEGKLAAPFGWVLIEMEQT